VKVCRQPLFVLLLWLCGTAASAQETVQPDTIATVQSIRPDSALVSLPVQRDSVEIQAAPDTIKLQPRPSPLALAVYKDETNYIKVVYSQPFRKGRLIFGGLAKWGEVWRTGANEASEITFIRDLKIDGKVCRAGTYTLFTIPNPNRWTVLLNSELGQWGAYSYKPEKDVIRFEVNAIKMDQIYEALLFQFIETDAGADLTLAWDDVKVTIPMAFSK